MAPSFPILSLCVLAFCAALTGQHRLAVVGGTVIDVSDRGRSTADLEDAVVLIEDGHITAVGPRGRTPVPEGFRRLDASGRFIVPGLIDAFAVCNNQAYANAYLYMGVTSILGVSGGRRGPMFLDADPTPHIYRLEDVGSEEADTEAVLARVDTLADEGVDVVLLMYQLPPDQLRAAAERARLRGMATIGELASSSYRDGLAFGLDAFVHTTRYSLGFAPEELAAGVAREPFSDELDSPKWRYYRWLSEADPGSERLISYAEDLARSSTFLIPTASLLHLHRPGAVNPWSFPIASLIDPDDVNMPADPRTGRQAWTDAQREAYEALARGTDAIERIYHRAGCRYLAGSATDVWGTMPGISLHTELAWLARLGLSPREVLACATSNPAEAFRWIHAGHVRPGCRGDLLVLDADPREDVANLRRIHRVIRRGAVLDRDRLARPPGSQDGEILARRRWVPSAELRAEFDYLDRVDIDSIRYVSCTLGVEGFLAVPRGDGPFPCLVDVRGGNREFAAISDRAVAGRIARYASWGYVVAATQFRGVAGGDGVEEFGGAEVADVLHLLDVLERIPEADTTRVGMTAGSRGGMTACLALRRTDRFRAAVLRAPLTDLVRWPSERPDHIETVYREVIPGYVSGREDLLVARSGTYWPEELCPTTPILLLQGTADWRIRPEMTLAFATALQGAKHPYELVMYQGADHGLRPRREEARRAARRWLDRYVRDAKR